MAGVSIASDAEFAPAVAHVEFAGPTVPAVEFHDQGSGVTADGNCMRIALISAPTTTPMVLSGLVVSLSAEDHRRRRDTSPQTPRTFYPVEPYHVAVVTTALNGSPLPSSLVGSTALEDTQPPVFLNCPTAPIVAQAAAGALSATASWPTLLAVDNIVPNPTVTGSAAPNSAFSVIDSPHTVTYVASDGVQESRCTFHVIVNAPLTVTTRSATVSSAFPLSIDPLPQRNRTRVRHALVTPSQAPLRTLTALDTSSFI